MREIETNLDLAQRKATEREGRFAVRSVSLIGGESKRGKGGAGGNNLLGQQESEASCAREEGGADRTGGINGKKETFFFQKKLKRVASGKRNS